MKKTKSLFFPIIIIATVFNSCTAHDNDGADMTDSGATWTLGTQQFKSDASDNDETKMYIHSVTGSTDGVFVKYGSEPHEKGAGATYKIVDFNKATLNSNEMAIEIDHGVSDVWLSTGGSGNDVATTYRFGEETRVSGSSITVRHYSSTGPQSDSTFATFDIGTR